MKLRSTITCLVYFILMTQMCFANDTARGDEDDGSLKEYPASRSLPSWMGDSTDPFSPIFNAGVGGASTNKKKST